MITGVDKDQFDRKHKNAFRNKAYVYSKYTFPPLFSVWSILAGKPSTDSDTDRYAIDKKLLASISYRRWEPTSPHRNLIAQAELFSRKKKS
jgi:hypothetical protein